MTRVLIVAGSVVVRAGLAAVMSGHPALEVVGSVGDSTALPQQMDALQPDVVLLESSPIEDILALLSSLEADPPQPALVLLMDDLPLENLGELVRLGVRAVLPPDASALEITAAVESAAVGLLVVHPDFVEGLLVNLPASRPLPETPTQPLTPREIEVLQMLAEGLGNKAIARRLYISEHTVKFHISSIFTKLHASSRTEAVMVGARQGLVLV